MIYLSIDVSKFKHKCYIADEANFDKGCHFEIKNSKDGFDFLLKKLSDFDKDEMRNSSMSKRACYYLRSSLFLAVFLICQNYETFKLYYDKKDK